MSDTEAEWAETLREGPPGSRGGALPARLGRYRVVEELGRGGMGVVLKAFDPQLKRTVAIKQITGAVGPDELMRFAREAQLTAKIKHPGIAVIYEVVSQGDGAPYLVMDHVEGRPLKALCREGPLQGRRAAEILAATAEAVALAHAAGIVHRDLKPHNIMVKPSGEPVVLDFGLARRVEDESLRVTQTGDVMGTPAYMSPEQAGSTRDASYPADVYSLGATLYECLTGRPPFQGASAWHILASVARTPPEAPSKLNSAVHRDLETICLKCLEKVPDKRYASASALAEDLRRFLDGEPIAARPIGTLARAWRGLRRNKTGTAAVGFAVLFLTGVPGILIYQERKQAHAERRRLDREDDLARIKDRALIKLKFRDIAGALDDASKVIRENPTDGDAYTLRGNTKATFGDTRGAADDFSRAIKLSEGRAAAPLVARLQLRFQQGEFDAALADTEEIARVHPDLPALHFIRGDIFRKKGNASGARAEYLRAVDLNPTFALGHYRLGDLHFLAQEFSEALSCYDRGLAADPWRAPDYLSRRAQAKTHLGDLPGALLDLDESIETWHADLPVRDLAAAFRIRAGARSKIDDPRGAALDCEQSLRYYPDQESAAEMRESVRKILGRPSRY